MPLQWPITQTSLRSAESKRDAGFISETTKGLFRYLRQRTTRDHIVSSWSPEFSIRGSHTVDMCRRKVCRLAALPAIREHVPLPFAAHQWPEVKDDKKPHSYSSQALQKRQESLADIRGKIPPTLIKQHNQNHASGKTSTPENKPQFSPWSSIAECTEVCAWSGMLFNSVVDEEAEQSDLGVITIFPEGNPLFQTFPPSLSEGRWGVL